VVDDLVALGVNHVTVTVNAVDPEIGAKVYPWMRINGRNKRGVEAAEYLLAAQEEGIRALHARGVTVKVNMIAIPTINATHLPEVARVVKSWGADLINVIPLIPVGRYPFWRSASPKDQGLCGSEESSQRVSAPDAPLRPLPGRRRRPYR
jgi:nitrogen fixation protein NifB